jgi:allantoate deiminase
MQWMDKANEAIRHCEELAGYTEEPGRITRTFLSPPVRGVHQRLEQWMKSARMTARLDAAGNLRGLRPGTGSNRGVLYLGSHIDTVPDAGAFDGVLGVVLAIALVEGLGARPLPFAIEVVAFSEEEGVRFGVPFIGSRALAGTLDSGVLERRDRQGKSVADAIREFGLDPGGVGKASLSPAALGYLEFHIEQGPVLEQLGIPLGVVDAIAGQSRLELVFAGQANHAGTTPAGFRRDALAGAAEWIGLVERAACVTPDLRATVGRIEVDPGASNVIPGAVRATLDVRHASDEVRAREVPSLVSAAEEIARRRGLDLKSEQRLDQPATPLDPALTSALERAVARTGFPVHRLVSGAGHDAMIMAQCCPSAMLFVRSPGGVSHHPKETVWPDDVAAALAAGAEFLAEIETRYV